MSTSRLSTMKDLWHGRARPALLALCLLCGTSGAWAACTRAPGMTERIVDMDMGNVYISPNLSLGAIIASRTFPIQVNGAKETVFDCPGGGTVQGMLLQGTLVGGGYPDVYSTDVPGVGIRLSRKISASQTTYYPHAISVTAAEGAGYFVPGTEFQVELIKTATVTGNGPLAKGIYTQYYGADGMTKSVLTTRLLGVGITIITPSCTVDGSSLTIPVPLGKVPVSSFRGMGSPADGFDRNFDIKLNCNSGAPTQNTIYLRMDAQNDPSNQPGVLQITQGGTNIARGVGIQVMDFNAMPVSFGSDALVGQSKDGAYVLTYTARYFQTGNQVTPGRADGTATFTLNYK